MDQKLTVSGICGTCIYRSDCLYLRESMKKGMPVLHCDEFDDSAYRKPDKNLSSCAFFAADPCFSITNPIPG